MELLNVTETVKKEFGISFLHKKASRIHSTAITFDDVGSKYLSMTGILKNEINGVIESPSVNVFSWCVFSFCFCVFVYTLAGKWITRAVCPKNAIQKTNLSLRKKKQRLKKHMCVLDGAENSSLTSIVVLSLSLSAIGTVLRLLTLKHISSPRSFLSFFLSLYSKSFKMLNSKEKISNN